jgi:hypothetical protein
MVHARKTKIIRRFLVSFGALAVLSAVPLCAQNEALSSDSKTKSWSPPRTPDGHVDFQGIWNNSTLTPLERPSEFAGKLILTKSEAAAYEKQKIHLEDSDRRDGGADADVARAYNEAFYDRGSQLVEVDGAKRSSLIVDPLDGRIPPLKPEARKRLEAARAEARRHPADSPKDRSPQERCIFSPRVGPPMLPGMYNNNYQIVQTPAYVMIFAEEIHDARIIPLDGRQHLPSDVRQWVGDSVGHWDGDTLVVDTTNFTSKTGFRGTGRNLHVIERFTRIDPHTILYRFTVDDPSTFTRAWTAESTFVAVSDEIYEYACHEGNYAMFDILRGARLEEKAAGQSAKKGAKNP